MSHQPATTIHQHLKEDQSALQNRSQFDPLIALSTTTNIRPDHFINVDGISATFQACIECFFYELYDDVVDAQYYNLNHQDLVLGLILHKQNANSPILHYIPKLIIPRKSPHQDQLLCTILSQTVCLKDLRFVTVSPRPNDPIRLAQFLSSLPTTSPLVSLGFFQGNLDRTTATTIATSSALTNLTTLRLENTQLGDECIKLIAASTTLTQLTTLMVPGNLISAECVQALAASTSLAQLTTLDLSFNKIGPQGCLCLALPTATALISTLHLRGCAIKDEGVMAITSSPNFAQLIELDLSSEFGLGLDSIKAIASSPHLSNLKRLRLSALSLGHQGAKCLATSTTLVNLIELGLSFCGIGDEGVREISTSTTLTKLTSLHLCHNNLSLIGAKFISSSKSLTNLTRLRLGNNPIGDQGIAFITSSQTLANLTQLEVSGCEIRASGSLPLGKDKS